MRQFLKAFTLAEVLITLGIIGVVAAITMPTLIGNYQKHVLYTQFRKAATQIEQAFKMYEVDNGCIGNITACKNYFDAEDISKYFNVVEFINNDNYESICKNYKGNKIYICTNQLGYSTQNYAFITIYGTLYNLSTDAGLGSGSVLDVNGPDKGPNEWGRDIFVFYTPWHYNDSSDHNDIVWGGNEKKIYSFSASCNGSDAGGCAAKLLAEGKMNY